jgi:hypothetical protein
VSASLVGLSLVPLLTAGGYHEYFGDDVDLEAMTYLMLVSDPREETISADSARPTR